MMVFSTENGIRRLLAKYLHKQAKLLAAQLNGCRLGEDVECIHQARVASRRLIEGMGLSKDCFRPKQVQRWRKEIRCLTKGLGEARDADVQIEFINGVLEGISDKRLRPGIARVAMRMRLKRKRLGPRIFKVLDQLEQSNVLTDIQQTCRNMDAKASVGNRDVKYPAERVRRYVLRRLDKLLTCQGSLNEPADKKGHHQMRIAAKHLRYCLEIFKSVFGGAINEHVKTVKTLQTLLGDLHDADVWIDLLKAFGKQERARTEKYYGHARPFRRLKWGIEHLMADRESHRKSVFAELVEFWSGMDHKNVWGGLFTMLQTLSVRPTGRQSPPARSEQSGPRQVV